MFAEEFKEAIKNLLKFFAALRVQRDFDVWLRIDRETLEQFPNP